MAEFASKGVAGTALGTGIAGLSLGVLNSLGGLGGMLLGNRVIPFAAGMAAEAGCSENHTVNRYGLSMVQENAKLRSDIALRDANTYQDQKMLEMYKYIDCQFKDIRGALCAQSVHNQKTEDSFTVAMKDLAAVKAELLKEIQIEAERRCCGDNSIVTYVNATFYPKQVADVTTGTTTTAQTLYNPLPNCGKN